MVDRAGATLQSRIIRDLENFGKRAREIEEMKRAVERTKGPHGQLLAATVAPRSCLVFEAFSVSSVMLRKALSAGELK